LSTAPIFGVYYALALCFGNGFHPGEGREMSTAKEEVRKLLEQLPDDSSFEDIQYHIYVREKIERGLQEVKEGRVLSQEEVERKMSKWLGG